MIVSELVTLLGFKTNEEGKKKYLEGMKQIRETVMHVAETIGAVEIGKSIIEEADRFEQAKIAFSTMLGSAAKANDLLKQIEGFAEHTPFQEKDLEGYAKQLLATGYSAQQIIPMLKSMGDVAAGVGMDKMPILVRAMGFMHNTGVADLGNLESMMEAGVPILDKLAQQMGMNKIQLKALVSAGRVGYAQVAQAMQQMTGKGGVFNDMMSKQMNTIGGLWSNLKDTLDFLYRDIGMKLLPSLKSVVKTIQSFIAANREAIINGVVKGFNLLAYVIGFIIGVIRGLIDDFGGINKVSAFFKANLLKIVVAMLAFGAAIRIVNMLKWIQEAIAVVRALKIWTAAQWLLNVAIDANPIGLIILGIAALAAAAYLIITHWKEVKAFLISTWKTILEVLKRAWDTVVNVWNNAKMFFDRLWNNILQIISNVWGWIVGIAKGVLDKIQGVWGRITGFFSGLWNGIKDTAIGIWTAISDFITGKVDAVKQKVQDVLHISDQAAQKLGLSKPSTSTGSARSGAGSAGGLGNWMLHGGAIGSFYRWIFGGNKGQTGAHAGGVMFHPGAGAGPVQNFNMPITVAVPAGTRQDQAAYLEDTVRRLANEHLRGALQQAGTRFQPAGM